MIKECSYCYIPKRELNSQDYFNKMNLWRQFVNKGIFRFVRGDTPIENFDEIISKELKYVYYHYFECKCGTLIRAGVCIRSSVPILEHIESIPSE